MKQITRSAMTLVALVSSTLVYMTMSTSEFQVQIPTELWRNGGYVHKEALFGIPKYGGSISERLLYGGLQKPWTFCTDEEAVVYMNQIDHDRAFILLLDRGGECSFVSKVRRAQHFGAAAVVVADNKCTCSDPKCKDKDCELVEPIMADDGSGQDITIPSFLLERNDSEAIKKHIQDGQLVKVEMNWNLPAPDDRVEWSLWTSAHDDKGLGFIYDFQTVIKDLGKHQYFQPFYQIANGVSYGCTRSADACTDLCTNGGRYCMNRPGDYTRQKPTTGADVVKETLRQRCIWNEYGGIGKPDEGVGMQYADKNCISYSMRESNINEGKINECMENSGGTEKNVTNSLLDKEINSMDAMGLVLIPSLYVNNVSELGKLSVVSVLDAICSGYASGTQPATCKCSGLLNSDMTRDCIISGHVPPGQQTTSSGISLGAVILIIIVVVLAMTAAGVVYWKRTQANMHDRVRGILSEYMLLDDTQDERKNEGPFEMTHGGVSDGDDHEYIAPVSPQHRSLI